MRVPRLLSLIAVWSALAACGPSSAAPGASTGARPAAPAPSAPAVATGNSASTSNAPALQALVDAARAEGQLTLLWGEGTLGGSANARELADGYNRLYGLNVNVQFTPGPSMANMTTKLIEERQADRRSTTDAFVGYSNHVSALSQAGALEAVDWRAWAPYITLPEQLAPNGVAVTFQTSTPGISYNTQRVSGDAIPRSMQDLLKPQYKGRIASTPYAANFDYLATDDIWGEQRTMDYLARLADQAAGLIRCNELERIISGEFDMLALDCSQSNTYEAKARGAPLDYVIPSDAALLVPLYIGVPSHAAHPNAAKLWVNYVLSPEIQRFLAEKDFTDSHLLPNSRTAKDLEALRAAGVKLIVTDVEFVQRQDEAEYSRRRTRTQQILNKQ